MGLTLYLSLKSPSSQSTGVVINSVAQVMSLTDEAIEALSFSSITAVDFVEMGIHGEKKIKFLSSDIWAILLLNG